MDIKPVAQNESPAEYSSPVAPLSWPRKIARRNAAIEERIDELIAYMDDMNQRFALNEFIDELLPPDV